MAGCTGDIQNSAGVILKNIKHRHRNALIPAAVFFGMFYLTQSIRYAIVLWGFEDIYIGIDGWRRELNSADKAGHADRKGCFR